MFGLDSGIWANLAQTNRLSGQPNVWQRMGTGLASGLATQYGDADPTYARLGARKRGAALGRFGGSPITMEQPYEDPLHPETPGFRSLIPEDGVNSSSEPAQPMRGQNDALRYFEEMERIRNNSGPALKAYREHISNMPMRENYEPSVWRRIGAALAGGAIAYNDPRTGIEAAMEFRDRPYLQALENYKMKGDMLGEQADIEQADTAAQLRALQAARALGLEYDKYDLHRREVEAKMGTDSKNADTNRMRAEAYVKAQGRPDFNYVYQEDGSLLAVNKADPSVRQVIPAKTIQAGNLKVSQRNASVAERNARSSEINAETNVRRANAYERSTQDASRRGWASLSIQNSRAGNSNIPNPREQQDATDNALRDMMNDPVFSEFIELDSQGYPALKEDDGSEDYQDVLEELDNRVESILKGQYRRRRK